MKVGSLFSGAGCGDLGLEWAGFEHAWFCEADEYARKVLAKNWPGVTIYEDIRDVDFTKAEPVELLAGGFPCQDISVAGKGEGIQGERSGLWSEFARAIAEIRPRYALIENSPALVTRGLDVVLSDLAALRYDAEWHCIPASAFGAPHKRNRIWIVAHTSCAGFGDYPGEIGLQGRDASEDGCTSVRQGHGAAGAIRTDAASKVVADAERNGRDSRRQDHQEYDRDIVAPGGEHTGEVADALFSGCQEFNLAPFAARAGQRTGCAPAEWGKARWSVEPELGRVAHGVAHRVDRLKGIGNGQVPVIPCFFGLTIREHYEYYYSKFYDNEE